MSTCNGNCGDCNSKKTIPLKSNRGISKQPDIKSYLVPFPRERHDSTPLSKPCTCTDKQKFQRYQCLPCIRSWVQTACPCKIEDALDRYKKSNIVTDRIKMCIEEIRRKARINGDGYIDVGSSNCSCKSDR